MVFWLASFIIQFSYFFNRKIEHFAPLGTPIWLLPLIILIEIVRQIIRPITLSVRLAANLTAGHLILSLLSSVSLNLRFFIQIPLILLEILVALVQPFVFCILIFLYFSENYFILVFILYYTNFFYKKNYFYLFFTLHFYLIIFIRHFL